MFINYDDSDGWYDHQLGQIVNQSTTAADARDGRDTLADADAAFHFAERERPVRVGVVPDGHF